MQLFALSNDGTIVSAVKAVKQKDYLCVECSKIVRLRGGIHRQNHFYHVEPVHNCHLNGKSMAHLQTQCYLQNCLPSKEAILECRFPAINRIADVAWIKQRIIFEIQCSPITSEEVMKRTQDYESLGFRVVWILHDRQFNKFKISACELVLKDINYYFTNIDEDGHGTIYDQYDWIEGGLRAKKLAPMAIRPYEIKYVSNVNSERRMPQKMSKRMQRGKLYFGADLVDLFCNDESEAVKAYFEEALAYEQSQVKMFVKEPWFRRYLFRPYSLLIQFLLERACR